MTYRDLQKQLKEYKKQGLTQIKLNSSKEELLTELKHIEKIEHYQRIGISEVVEIIKLDQECKQYENENSYSYDINIEKYTRFLELYNKVLTVLIQTKALDGLENKKETTEILLEKCYQNVKDDEFWELEYEFYFDYDEFDTLGEFGLVYWDREIPKIDYQIAFDYMMNEKYHVNSIEPIAFKAAENEDYLFLAALGYGLKPPVIPDDYWTEQINTGLEKYQKHEISYSAFIGVSRYYKTKYKDREYIKMKEFWYYAAHVPTSVDNPIFNILSKFVIPSSSLLEILENTTIEYDPFYYKPDEIKVNGNMRSYTCHSSVFGKWEREKKLEAKQQLREWLEQLRENLTINEINQVLKYFKQSFEYLWEISETEELRFDGTWWEILGVERFTQVSIIKKRYKELMKKYHPDINSHPKAEEYAKKITAAYRDALIAIPF